MKPITRIVGYVLEQAQKEPLPKRAALYRDLACISGTAKESAQLNDWAAELEAIEAKHQQLVLDFKRRSEA